MTPATLRPTGGAPASPAGPTAASPLRRARHRLRTYASEHPRPYLPFARHKYTWHGTEPIGPGTELVIDGYTRSATTFAVYAFQLSQDRPVRLAHHLHAPAQLIEAARRGTPALALIREPRGAILSQLTREPGVALQDALVAYSRFYERLLPYRGRLVTGEFEQVTHDFGTVVRELNQRFGTAFGPFTHSHTNVRECLELCELRGTWSPVLFAFESGLITRAQLRRERPAITRAALREEREAWVPSVDRDRAIRALRRQWQQPSLDKLRCRAERAYQEFLTAGQARTTSRGHSRPRPVSGLAEDRADS